MMKLRLKLWPVLAGCLLMSSTILMGQRQISGTVTDKQSGEPLIGVNILLVGTSSGTITDIDGSYQLNVPEGVDQIQFSYTGYTVQTINLGSSNVVDLSLEAGTLLDEVVVIGYGTVKREDATGSVATVGEEEFNKGSITGAQELIVGKIPGVEVATSGVPGEGGAIRIRGGSSLSASNDPLIVIDGVPIANDGVAGSRNPLNIVNPNDIETFTILKDASATAIYGSRASNGVVLITTKKGNLDKPLNIEYNGNVSVSNAVNTVDVLTADQFRALINERYAEGHPARGLLGNENTDWQDQIFEAGVAHNHNLSFSGGVGPMPYRLSLGYTDKNGILMNDNFNRLTGALNLSPGLLDNTLQFNLNVKGMVDKNHFADQGAIGNALFMDPTKPVLDPESVYQGYYTWTNPDGSPNTLATTNPVALLNLRDNDSKVNRFIINGSADYRMPFLPELRANLSLGYDKSDTEGTVFVPADAAFNFVDGGRDEVYTQDKENKLLEFYLNYAKSFGRTNLDVMGGYSWQHFFREDYFFASNVDGSEILTPENYNPREYYLLSLFGRLNYSILDKYLFTFTLRRDGTSRFSEDNRWGLFPAAAFAWKAIDNENGKLNTLKVRLGYGVTGQQDIGLDYYPYLARYLSSFDNARYQIGGEFVTTLRPQGYDSNIKWEETTTYNVGLDFGFFRDRLSGTLDVYYRKTEDLINFIPVPAGTNLTNFINTNVGDLENKGLELGINAIPVQKTDLSWSVGVNVTYNENEITKLTATDDPSYLGVFTGGISGGVGNTIQVHSVGHSANTFFVYEQVYGDNGEPVEGLYVDRNGDGIITPDDRYHFKDPRPDVTLGFNTGLNYKNFDLTLAGRAQVGNYVYNNNLSNMTIYPFLYGSSGYLGNLNAGVLDQGFNNTQYFSDYYVHNASFLKLDHITLGYDLSGLTSSLQNIRVYATVQNPFVITKYDGIDPEVFRFDGTERGTQFGIDNNMYPRSRTFLFGLSVRI